MMKQRNFRKRSRVDDGEDDSSTKDNNGSDDEQERRSVSQFTLQYSLGFSILFGFR